MIIDTFINKKIAKTSKIRNTNNIDIDLVSEHVKAVDWSCIYSGNNVDKKMDQLYMIMHNFMNKFCPYEEITSRYDPVPWINTEIKNLMAQRKLYYDWWIINRKRQSSRILYSSYARTNNDIKYRIRESKKQNFEYDYHRAEDSKSKWNLIHRFGTTRKSQKMGKITIMNAINSIKSNGTGPDDMPPKFVRAMAEFIAATMAHIINESFISQGFPRKLKSITITPIAKVECPTIPSQYRPICSANFLLKVISKITCQQFYNYLENNSLIYDNQSGFRHGRVCVTAILKLTEDIHLSISNGKCVIPVLLDFANAFGSVDHGVLLAALKNVGVTGSTLNWYQNFMRDWTQVINFNNEFSPPKTITRGIIQGENSSQLLFSIFMNNITIYIKNCQVLLYADDVQL